MGIRHDCSLALSKLASESIRTSCGNRADLARLVAPLVTGNPETNTDLIGDQAHREDLD
jgi:hypothetical protein